jgi:hypothetical protein
MGLFWSTPDIECKETELLGLFNKTIDVFVDEKESEFNAYTAIFIFLAAKSKNEEWTNDKYLNEMFNDVVKNCPDREILKHLLDKFEIKLCESESESET